MFSSCLTFALLLVFSYDTTEAFRPTSTSTTWRMTTLLVPFRIFSPTIRQNVENGR